MTKNTGFMRPATIFSFIQVSNSRGEEPAVSTDSGGYVQLPGLHQQGEGAGVAGGGDNGSGRMRVF